MEMQIAVWHELQKWLVRIMRAYMGVYVFIDAYASYALHAYRLIFNQHF